MSRIIEPPRSRWTAGMCRGTKRTYGLVRRCANGGYRGDTAARSRYNLVRSGPPRSVHVDLDLETELESGGREWKERGNAEEHSSEGTHSTSSSVGQGPRRCC